MQYIVFLASSNQRRKQDEYNHNINQCTLFFLFIENWLGRYSEEAFDYAWQRLKDANSSAPFRVFAKKHNQPAHETSTNFMEKLNGLEQFITPYEERNCISEELHASNPQDIFFTNCLAVSYARLALLQEKLSNSPETISLFKKGIILWESLVASFPQYTQFRKYIAMAINQLEQLKK